MGEGDVAAGHAYLAEMVKQQGFAQETLGLPGALEDLVVQTNAGTLMVRPIGEMLWTVLCGAGANPALVRAVMRNHHQNLEDALNED